MRYLTTFFAVVFNAYANALNFRGRSNRTEYWTFFFFNAAVLGLALYVDSRSPYPIASETEVFINGLIILLLINRLVALSLIARRLHDQNLSGWFMLVYLVPAIGTLVLLMHMLRRPDVSDNRFGKPSTFSYDSKIAPATHAISEDLNLEKKRSADEVSSSNLEATRDLSKYSPSISKALAELKELPDFVSQEFADLIQDSPNKEAEAAKILNKITEKYDENFKSVVQEADIESGHKYLRLVEELGSGASKTEIARKLVEEYQSRQKTTSPIGSLVSPPAVGLYEDFDTGERLRILDGGAVLFLSGKSNINTWQELQRANPKMKLHTVRLG
jgi:uncharacterized membrane protein YhaH (DUF805 family)